MLADLITKLETRIDASVTRGNGCVRLGKGDAARLLRLLRAGEKAAAAGRNLYRLNNGDVGAAMQREKIIREAPAALREWDEAVI